MLSDVDIRKHLGKEIGIYPFNPNGIQASSIDLTASDLAWSIKTKKSVYSNGEIIIPPHDTVVVITKESVFLSKHLAGYVISRVSTVAHGIGAICNPVKPNWIGRLFLSFHNVSDDPYKLYVGNKIALLVLHELGSTAKEHDPKTNCRPDLIAELGLEFSQIQKEDINKPIYTEKDSLFHAMKESKEYKNYLRKYSPLTKRIKISIALALVSFTAALVLIVLYIHVYKGNQDIQSVLSIIITAVLALFFTTIADVIKNIGV